MPGVHETGGKKVVIRRRDLCSGGRFPSRGRGAPRSRPPNITRSGGVRPPALRYAGCVRAGPRSVSRKTTQNRESRSGRHGAARANHLVGRRSSDHASPASAPTCADHGWAPHIQVGRLHTISAAGVTPAFPELLSRSDWGGALAGAGLVAVARRAVGGRRAANREIRLTLRLHKRVDWLTRPGEPIAVGFPSLSASRRAPSSSATGFPVERDIIGLGGIGDHGSDRALDRGEAAANGDAAGAERSR